jgi:hypothetical protein
LGDDVGRGVAVASNGDIAIIADAPDNAFYGGSVLTNAGSDDIVLARYDSTGTHLWSKIFGDNASQTARAIAIASNGDAVICGNFEGVVDFGGGSLSNAGGTGSSDIFIARFSASGAHVWSMRFGDTGTDRCRALAIDGNGEIIAAGSYQGSIDFGGTNLTSLGGDGASHLGDIFIIKLTESGSLVWAKSYGGTASDTAHDVSVDANGTIYAVGWSLGTADFGTGTTAGMGGEDAWLATYTTDGEPVWSQRWGGSGNDRALEVVIMSNGDAVVAGHFTGSADFGGGPMSDPGGGLAGWLARYDQTDGGYLWSRILGGVGNQSYNGLAVDQDERLRLVGRFENDTDFGDGPVTSAGSDDIFIATLDAGGSHVASRIVGSTGSDKANRVVVDALGFTYVTGYFAETVDFGSGDRVSLGGRDMFLAKYAP